MKNKIAYKIKGKVYILTATCSGNNLKMYIK